jgi:hypothetical protein
MTLAVGALRTLLAGLVLLFAQPATAADLPPGVAAGWKLTGQGDMRWFGFRLYSARLWSAPQTSWRLDSAPATDARFALELTYARDIKGDHLVDASIDELTRLGWRDNAKLALWRTQLSVVFPDVREGDRIVGLRDPAQGAVFYHQGQRTGTIADPELAAAFFAIWLDPRTREPALRARLLGQS